VLRRGGRRQAHGVQDPQLLRLHWRGAACGV
jgi:hypothetical protein